MKELRKFFWYIISIISFLSLILLLISAFSDRISPISNSSIPYLGLFFPFILTFNFIFLIIWILFQKWRQVVITIIFFVICWGSIRTYFPINIQTKQVPQNSIKVLTYNTMLFEHHRKHSKENPNPIIEYVIEQDPDIVCFQEAGFFLNNPNKLMEKDVKNALKKMPHYRFLKLNFPHKDQVFGLAIFSKHPIISAELLPLESGYNGAALVELDVNGKKITLINCHLESNKISGDERSDYYNLTKEPDSQKLEAFTHMMFQRLTPAYKLRAAQAQIINTIIENNKNDYIIVCGDFNDTPISYAHHKIKGKLKDSFVESGSGMGITFNRYRFYFRIDYILHSKNMKAYQCTVGKLKNSDHYPVWTYLELN